MHKNVTIPAGAPQVGLWLFVSASFLGVVAILLPTSICWLTLMCGRASAKRRANAAASLAAGTKYTRDRTHVCIGATCACAVFLAFICTIAAWWFFVAPLRRRYKAAHRIGEWNAQHACVIGLMATVFTVWLLVALISFLLLLHYDEGQTALLRQNDHIEGQVRDLLASGKIRLLRCAWLRDEFGGMFGSEARESSGNEVVKIARTRLDRRQEMPEAAFFSAEAAVAIFDGQQAGVVYVLSYGWLTPRHCDPCAQHLRSLLAALEDASCRYGVQDDAFFWDGAALFWDFASMHQKPRTAEEESIFRESLRAMGGLYGSLLRTTVIRLTSTPPPPPEYEPLPSDEWQWNARPYTDRGWPTFETFAARLAAGHRAHARVRGREPIVLSIGEDQKVTYTRWEAPPPLEVMLAALERTIFTGKGDQETVIAMLRQYNAQLAELAERHVALGGLQRCSPKLHAAYCQLLEALADLRDSLQSRQRWRRFQHTVSAADHAIERQGSFLARALVDAVSRLSRIRDAASRAAHGPGAGRPAGIVPISTEC